MNRAANLFFSLRANISYCKIAQNISIWTLTKTFFISASTLKLAEETRGRSIITILQAYSLKELYTSDTTLPQMIDLTPPSNELWGKNRSDPPPWKSWKKLLSVRILYGPVRNLYGPVRLLNGPVRICTVPFAFWTVRFFFSNAHAGARGGGLNFFFKSLRAPSARSRTVEMANGTVQIANGTVQNANGKQLLSRLSVGGGQIEFSPITRY